MATAYPVDQKRLGFRIKGYKEIIRKNKAEQVMESGLKANFEQNYNIRNFLLGTKDKLLIEANPNDTKWSCGLPLTSNAVWDIKAWKGKNKLGDLLMKLRDIVKTNY